MGSLTVGSAAVHLTKCNKCLSGELNQIKIHQNETLQNKYPYPLFPCFFFFYVTSAYFAKTAQIDVQHRTDPIFNLSIENNFNNRNAKKRKSTRFKCN